METKKFLNKDGLTVLWEKVKNKAELAKQGAINDADEKNTALKNELVAMINNISVTAGALQGLFTEGAANKAIADQNGAVIHENYIPNSLKGVANGLATLDTNGKVPATQLPSYVDDILEYATKTSFPTSGEAGKIYVAQDTNRTYRWTGTVYVEIKGDLTLGEITGTAYDGGKGAANASAISALQGQVSNLQESVGGLNGTLTNYYTKEEVNAIKEELTMTPLTTSEIETICQ